MLAGGVGEAIYVASTAAVLIAVLRNLRIPGMALIALGAASNLAAIVANGGVMPTTADALAAAGLEPTDEFSNSAVLDDPALAPLTDIYALPAWLPFSTSSASATCSSRSASSWSSASACVAGPRRPGG